MPRPAGFIEKPTEGRYSYKEELELCDSGFLTKAQQETLDAAVREKQKSGALVKAKSHTQEETSPISLRSSSSQSLEPKLKDKAYDRHSRGRSDRCKKGGAGGKFNWGATVDLEAGWAGGVQDRGDPNYDSDQEADRHMRLKTTPIGNTTDCKKEMVNIAAEFLTTGDVSEATASLQEVRESHGGSYFVRKLVVMALDGNSRECEMASSLLSAVYSVAVSADQMEKGFLDLLETSEDLKLDVPRALDLLPLFVARAVIDDLLPPIFVTKLSLVECKDGKEVLRRAEALLKAPHSAERILRCWGGGVDNTFTRTRDYIANMLREYASAHDKQEAVLCLRNLGLPLVHHEVVKQALVLALEHPAEKDPMLDLLSTLATQGHISETQLLKGFKRLSDSLVDLELDVLSARQDFECLRETAEMQGWLPDAGVSEDLPAPLKGRSSSDLGLAGFKSRVLLPALKEYFASGDSKEVARCLQELNQAGFHSLVVNQAIRLALEGKEREKEMVARLLRDLSSDLLTRDQVAFGFTRLLSTAEDLMLDVPNADHQLSLFLARSIVDEVLPPAFLTAALPFLENQSQGVNIVEATGKLLSTRHAAERVQLCWHSADFSVEDLRARIKDLVREYAALGDEEEAAHCWRDLDVTFFGHQLVYTILLAAFENPAKEDLLLRLIRRFEASGEVSQTQIQKGFQRVEAQLADLQLDYPASPQEFASYKAAAERFGWLSLGTPSQAEAQRGSA